MNTVYLDSSEIIPGNNDRTRFDADALRELAESIRSHGLLQPLTVRPIPDTDTYQIIAGERRFRACGLLGITSIPCILREATDEEASALMLAENIARADLDPMDEAMAYASRQTIYGWSVKEISDKAGVSTVRVLFRLKLLRVDPAIQQLIRTGNLALGYAQPLADAGLDSNRQLMALRALHSNPSPTPAWFRQYVSRLAEQQHQETFLADDVLTAPQITLTAPSTPDEPPLPSRDRPPSASGTIRDILTAQAAYWTGAASAWAQRGKPFKRQECEAAASALRFTLESL